MAFIEDTENFKQIFPSGKRANGNANYLLSRKMTENNLTNMILMLADRKSFIITDPDKYSPTDTSALLEFCVGGYYFSCTN